MRDFNIEDWKEVCNRLRDYEHQYAQERKGYVQPVSVSGHINEMAIHINVYRDDKVIAHRGHLYNTICNIALFGRVFSENIKHWRNELRTVLKELYDPNIKGGISKKNVLMKNLIRDYLNPETFEPEDKEMFLDAVNEEIRKGIIENKNKDVAYIQEYILPNLEYLWREHTSSISRLMKKVYTTVIHKQRYEMFEAVEDFIASETDNYEKDYND